MKPLEELTRKNIWEMTPYSCARNEYSGSTAHVLLDANESPYSRPYNRYPDPLQREVKKLLSKVKGVAEECIFLGNGSDEAIDLVYRCFATPGVDNVVAIDPTYGMYAVCAQMNDIAYRTVSLDERFQISAERLLEACDEHTKVIWICSPNNPTGNCLEREEIVKVLQTFEGLVVVDEAYSDFSREPSFRSQLAQFPNLIVLNTMSKAWGCAAIRLGMAFAQAPIIEIFNKVKYPYNVNELTQQEALQMLKDPYEVDKWVRTILQERSRLAAALHILPICKRIFPSEANFLLVEMTDANGIYDYLLKKGIIVRNRHRVKLCQNCLRITVGTKTENNELLAALREIR